jgi:hypothetical protein
MTAEVSPAHKAWALILRDQLPGANRQIGRYFDETNAHHVDVFTAEDPDGIIAATIGLMDLDVSPRASHPIHTEILMDARGSHPSIAQMLSSIAFRMIKEKSKPAPGVVFPSIVEMYDRDLEVKHVMFTPTIQWETGLQPVTLPGTVVRPLLAVPITAKEYKLVEQHGSEALERIWEAQSVDVFRWSRASAVC